MEGALRARKERRTRRVRGRAIDVASRCGGQADMWSAYMSEEGEGGQIVFVLPAQVSIGAVRLWNYNKSMLDSDKGVR